MKMPCLLIIGLLALAQACCLSSALAICVPIPCIDCSLFSRGQLTLVLMDRSNSMVGLIPNILIQGEAQDFALIVPTPSLPEVPFIEVGGAIWRETADLTKPVARRNGTQCGRTQTGWSPTAADVDDAGVIVHSDHVVGAFQVTVLSSDDPDALVTWLINNNYQIEATDADKFTSFVERGWFFSAMKLDTSNAANQMPPGGWFSEVNPVLIRYSATNFEVPLPIMSINRTVSMPVGFYVRDDHRVALDGFATLYANRLSDGEYSAIRTKYPTLASLLSSGCFFTALQRNFTSTDAMTASIPLQRAPSDQEFRRGWLVSGLPVELALLFMALFWARRLSGSVLRQRHYWR